MINESLRTRKAIKGTKFDCYLESYSDESWAFTLSRSADMFRDELEIANGYINKQSTKVMGRVVWKAPPGSMQRHLMSLLKQTIKAMKQHGHQVRFIRL